MELNVGNGNGNGGNFIRDYGQRSRRAKIGAADCCCKLYITLTLNRPTVFLHLCGSESTYGMFFEALPDDLLALILGELDLDSLITVSYLSKRLHSVASEPSLNPWRKPILHNLRTNVYGPALQHLSVRSTVPRQNWIEILVLARPSFILYETTLPNLKAVEWEECFRRRFLPGWQKWKKESPWKEAFLKCVDYLSFVAF